MKAGFDSSKTHVTFTIRLALTRPVALEDFGHFGEDGGLLQILDRFVNAQTEL